MYVVRLILYMKNNLQENVPAVQSLLVYISMLVGQLYKTLYTVLLNICILSEICTNNMLGKNCNRV